MSEKKIMVSGIKPSGKITLGNYIGALKNWVANQDEFENYYFIADLHSITERQEPAKLRKQTLDSLALYLACGLDPEKNIIFIQSHVAAHPELSWVLSNMTYMGELNRMTQYKDKSKKNEENLNAGLFTYPVLMAADILLYQADYVPVGEDQKQHLELTRDLANRFNNRYSDTFTVPEPYIPKAGARIMSLQEPTSKMGKSDDNENGVIYITDTPEEIRRKFKRAVTDSIGVVQYSDDQPGIKNLLTIYSVLTERPIDDIVKDYEGKGYGDFKTDVGEVVIEALNPIREKYEALISDKKYLQSIYQSGAEKAEKIARKTLRKVYKKTGFVPRF